MSAAIWLTLTPHTAHSLRRAGAEAIVIGDATSESIAGRRVVVAASASRTKREMHAAARRAHQLGAAEVRMVEAAQLKGATDIADALELGVCDDLSLPRIAREAPCVPADSAKLPRVRSVPGALAAQIDGDDGRIVLRCVAGIEARAVRWLWPARIARGKVSVLAGHPGLGKSQVCLSLAAIVTTAGRWPVDRTHCERGSVVIFSAEDDPEDTIRPRLEAAGADLTRCHILDAVEDRAPNGTTRRRTFSLATDLPRLSAALSALPDVALVVIDPVTAYLGDTDSHNNADVRAVLAPLAELAARHGAAIIAVSHLRKSGAGEALLQVTGSLAFVAAARAAYIVAKDQNVPVRRLMLPVKNNLGDDQSGYAFRIESVPLTGGIETSRVTWEAERVTVTADEALAPAQDPAERSAVEDAAEFLRGLLADGPVPSKQVRADAEGAGHSWAAVRRAQRALGVEVVKAGLRSGWEWRLAPKMLKTPEDAQEKNVSTFTINEHLRRPAGAPAQAGDANSEVF